MKRLLVALLLCVTACSPAQDTQSNDTENNFVNAVHEVLPQTRSIDDETLLDIAYQICEDFEEISITTTSLYSYADGMAHGSNGTLTSRDAAVFMGAATASFCPDTAKEILDTDN